MRILGPANCASSFRSWCLSLSKSRTRTRSSTRSLLHYAHVFPSYLVSFSDIDRTAKVRSSSFQSIILSIFNPSGPSSILYTSPSIASCVVTFVISGITSCALFYVNFYSGTNPSIISSGVNPWKRSSLPLTKGKILRMLRQQIVFASGLRSNNHFLTSLMANSTFPSTKPTQKEWLIGARI